jgi:hypothetical protein
VHKIKNVTSPPPSAAGWWLPDPSAQMACTDTLERIHAPFYIYHIFPLWDSSVDDPCVLGFHLRHVVALKELTVELLPAICEMVMQAEMANAPQLVDRLPDGLEKLTIQCVKMDLRKHVQRVVDAVFSRSRFPKMKTVTIVSYEMTELQCDSKDPDLRVDIRHSDDASRIPSEVTTHVVFRRGTE